MTNSLKFVLPMALVVAVGFTGCASEKADDATDPQTAVDTEVGVDETVPEPKVEPEPRAEPETNAGEPAAANGEPEKKVNPMVQQIKEQLAPERISATLDEGLAKLIESLAQITDEAAATEARPKLQAFGVQMSMMNAMSNMVPPESKPIIVEKVSAALEPLKEAFEKIYENEAVKAKLQPVSDTILRNLEQVVEKFKAKPDEDDAEGDEDSEDADSAEETDAE